MDGELEVAKISTPDAMEARRLGSAAMAKKLQIAAVNEEKTALDEGDDGIAQWRCPPEFCVDARPAVDRDGDLAIARAVHMAVGGAEFEPEAPPLLGGHARIARRRAAHPDARHSREGINAIEDVGIERNQRGELIVRNRAGKEKNPQIVLGKGRIDAFRGVTPYGKRVGGCSGGRRQKLRSARQQKNGAIA